MLKITLMVPFTPITQFVLYFSNQYSTCHKSLKEDEEESVSKQTLTIFTGHKTKALDEKRQMRTKNTGTYIHRSNKVCHSVQLFIINYN